MAQIEYTITVSDGFHCPRGFSRGAQMRNNCLTCNKFFTCFSNYTAYTKALALGSLKDALEATTKEETARKQAKKRRKELPEMPEIETQHRIVAALTEIARKSGGMQEGIGGQLQKAFPDGQAKGTQAQA